jgi:hypothetical protein
VIYYGQPSVESVINKLCTLIELAFWNISKDNNIFTVRSHSYNINNKLLSRAGLSHSAGQPGHMASGGYLSTAVKQMLISCVCSYLHN